MRPVKALLVVLSLPLILATWKDEHVVTGLPTLDRAHLRSYAGAVPVRKDHDHNVEVCLAGNRGLHKERSLLLAF